MDIWFSIHLSKVLIIVQILTAQTWDIPLQRCNPPSCPNLPVPIVHLSLPFLAVADVL